MNTQQKIISFFEDNKTSFGGNISEREKAIQAFSKVGFPNKKNEEYKYSNIESLAQQNFDLDTKTAEITIQIPSFDEQEIKIVFVDGAYSSKLSTNTSVKGIAVSNLAAAFVSHTKQINEHFSKYLSSNADPLNALNNALAKEGTFILCDENTVFEKPIHIINIATSNSFSQQRNLILVEKSASLKVIETFLNNNDLDKSFTTNASEIIVKENAHLEHYIVQNENNNSNLVKITEIHQSANSVVNTGTFTLNGGFVRNNLTIVLDAENCESNLNGLYIPNKKQHVDNHTLVDHKKPNCNSNELYKGVAMDESTAVFNGKIFVRKDAQKTNAFQSNKNILMSDEATVNTKPQLEIYANDVKCSHGTSTGEIDEDALFYLQARGIGKENAMKLMLKAFAGEVIEKINLPMLQVFVETEMLKKIK